MQFSFSRFSYLFKLQISVNRKFYLLVIAAIAGIMICFMSYAVFSSSNGLTSNKQLDFFSAGLILSSGFFGSLIFKQYGDKDKRIQSILLPVSNAERLAIAVLFLFLLFPLVFLLIYMISILIANVVDVHVMGNMNEIYTIDGYEGKSLLMLYCFIQSIVLLGAIWFRRYTFVKNIVLVCILCIGISVANDMINKAVFKGGGEKVAALVKERKKTHGPSGVKYYTMVNSSPFHSIRFHSLNEQGVYMNGAYWVSLPDSQMIPFMILLGFIPLFFFYITGLKLREQQL